MLGFVTPGQTGPGDRKDKRDIFCPQPAVPAYPVRHEPDAAAARRMTYRLVFHAEADAETIGLPAEAFTALIQTLATVSRDPYDPAATLPTDDSHIRTATFATYGTCSFQIDEDTRTLRVFDVRRRHLHPASVRRDLDRLIHALRRSARQLAVRLRGSENRSRP